MQDGRTSFVRKSGSFHSVHRIHRRQVIAGLPLLLGLTRSAQAASEPSLAEVEQRHGGRLGVFALDTGNGRVLAHRADERFLMCSTFKGPLAALVLSRVDAGQENLSRTITYTKSDLVITSPVTEAHVEKGAMAVGDLLQAVQEFSDNTAAILLMRSSGGPAGLTTFLRGIGDTVTRSDRYEPMANDANGALDTTTPRAIVETARKILLGDVLKPESRARLEAGMVACKPGLKRLRAALPQDWMAGDRPGTSLDGETNDYAIVRPPHRAPLLVAAHYNAPKLNAADREMVLREAGSVFVKWAQS